VVAQQTFKFVKVLTSESPAKVEESAASVVVAKTTTYAFESIEAPWRAEVEESWNATLDSYKVSKRSKPLSNEKQEDLSENKKIKAPWRPQLLDALGESIDFRPHSECNKVPEE
jgi:hypothetical protein